MPWTLDVHDDNDDLDSIETDVKVWWNNFIRRKKNV